MHKPFTTFDAQVALLALRGLKTDSKTKIILQRESYYSVVNGYKAPFIDPEATRQAGDDRYLTGTSFNDLYTLFSFDRELRFLCFQIITLAEATLRTACSYTFSAAHPDEPNAYLNIMNYAKSGDRRVRAGKLIPVLKKIIEKSTDKKGSGSKAYLVHCKYNHDGEIPLWVLSNNLSIGQMFWMFQSFDRKVRGRIARIFSDLYSQSHRQHKDIAASRLDSAFRRIKNYRNICAHDERFYSAHPLNRNSTVFLLVQDLHLVTEKQKFLEFLQKLESLLAGLEKTLPNHVNKVYEEMGLAGLSEFQDYMEVVRAS